MQQMHACTCPRSHQRTPPGTHTHTHAFCVFMQGREKIWKINNEERDLLIKKKEQKEKKTFVDLKLKTFLLRLFFLYLVYKMQPPHKKTVPKKIQQKAWKGNVEISVAKNSKHRLMRKSPNIRKTNKIPRISMFFFVTRYPHKFFFCINKYVS